MNVLVRPIITEQSLTAAQQGKFTFLVELEAGKDAVKKEVESTYAVHVTDVATVIVKGKVKRVGKKRTEKKVGKYKKAVVTLKKGEKIDAFDLGEQK